MPKKIRLLLSHSPNPYFNLAYEDWIFRDMDPEIPVLFLWRNQPCVVIGRFQNPWAECHLEKMSQDNVLLVRRQSGGGAVFQDLGNTNFTFMAGRKLYDKAVNNQIILKALQDLGVMAQVSGRNDIVVSTPEGDKKISGSAYKENRDRCFHHGTMLINANLSRLSDYLNPDKKKLEMKGITSVRSRVMNLQEINPQINHELLCQKVIEHFFSHYQLESEVEILSEDQLGPKDYFEHLKSDLWRLGETPEFAHHFEERLSFGQLEVYLQVIKGVIKKATLYSDSLHPEMIECMALEFEGQNYDAQGISQAFLKAKGQLPMLQSELLEAEDFFLKQIK